MEVVSPLVLDRCEVMGRRQYRHEGAANSVGREDGSDQCHGEDDGQFIGPKRPALSNLLDDGIDAQDQQHERHERAHGHVAVVEHGDVVDVGGEYLQGVDTHGHQRADHQGSEIPSARNRLREPFSHRMRSHANGKAMVGPICVPSLSAGVPIGSRGYGWMRNQREFRRVTSSQATAG